MKTIEFTTVALVQNITYKNTSYFGNNSYWVSFGDMLGYTAPNHSCGYGCHNYKGKEAKITYHFTKGGKCVITDISDPK